MSDHLLGLRLGRAAGADDHGGERFLDVGALLRQWVVPPLGTDRGLPAAGRRGRG